MIGIKPHFSQLSKPLISKVIYRPFSGTLIRSNDKTNDKTNELTNQLFEAVNSQKQASKSSQFNDSLIGVLNELDVKPNASIDYHDDLGLSASTKMHPRDIAKNIRMSGPLAGRTIDARRGGLGFSLSNLRQLLMSNKVMYLQKVQRRHIPKAKYRKQLKREWWRRRFMEGFKGLMAQVNDAKRRGY